MSGRHSQRAVWHPGGRAVAVAVGVLVWAAVAVALLLGPDGSSADVQGSLADAGTDAGDVVTDDDPPVAVPPQTLRLAESSAVDATPSDRRAGPSRETVLAALQATAAAEAQAEADDPGATTTVAGTPGAEPVRGGGGPTGGPTTGGDPGGPTTGPPTTGPTDPATSTATSTTTTTTTSDATTSEPTTSGSTHTPPGQTRTPTHSPHTP